jgi:hypothetical protein
MAMKQKSVASEEKFLPPEILGEKKSLPVLQKFWGKRNPIKPGHI